LEPLDDPRLGCNLGTDRLEGDSSPKLEVLRFVDLPHPALREKSHDLEALREDVVGAKGPQGGGRADPERARSRRGRLAAWLIFWWGHPVSGQARLCH